MPCIQELPVTGAASEDKQSQRNAYKLQAGGAVLYETLETESDAG
jgi:hypothetical protein